MVVLLFLQQLCSRRDPVPQDPLVVELLEEAVDVKVGAAGVAERRVLQVLRGLRRVAVELLRVLLLVLLVGGRGLVWGVRILDCCMGLDLVGAEVVQRLCVLQEYEHQRRLASRSAPARRPARRGAGSTGDGEENSPGRRIVPAPAWRGS